jgi:hypothetical protein
LSLSSFREFLRSLFTFYVLSVHLNILWILSPFSKCPLQNMFLCKQFCVQFLFNYYLLTAIGLMSGGSVTKIGRTYKKWTYIARTQNIHLTKKQHISQNFPVQYKCNEQNTRYNK